MSFLSDPTNFTHVVFEGADGSGKSTLCEAVYRELKATHKDVFKRVEPTKTVRPHIEAATSRREMLQWFTWDRMLQMHRNHTSYPAPEIVVQDRSWISTCVYQAENDTELSAYARFQYQMYPVPDLIVWCRPTLYDTLERVRDRDSRDRFEQNEAQITLHYDRYRQVFRTLETLLDEEFPKVGPSRILQVDTGLNSVEECVTMITEVIKQHLDT